MKLELLCRLPPSLPPALDNKCELFQTITSEMVDVSTIVDENIVAIIYHTTGGAATQAALYFSPEASEGLNVGFYAGTVKNEFSPKLSFNPDKELVLVADKTVDDYVTDPSVIGLGATVTVNESIPQGYNVGPIYLNDSQIGIITEDTSDGIYRILFEGGFQSKQNVVKLYLVPQKEYTYRFSVNVEKAVLSNGITIIGYNAEEFKQNGITFSHIGSIQYKDKLPYIVNHLFHNIDGASYSNVSFKATGDITVYDGAPATLIRLDSGYKWTGEYYSYADVDNVGLDEVIFTEEDIGKTIDFELKVKYEKILPIIHWSN